MNSERRRKKGLQNQPRGKFRKLQTYETDTEIDQPQNLQTYEDTQTPNENLSEFETYDASQENIEPEQDLGIRLNDPNNVPIADELASENKTAAGKFFGFIRNRFDDVTEDWKLKKEAKSNAYKQWIAQKPQVYEQRYLERFQNNDLNNSDRFNDVIQNFTTGARNVGRALGGNITPDRVMGFKGTILGPLPTGGYNTMQQMPGQQFPVTGLQNQYSSMPSQYTQPGVVGSQVPRYSGAPTNAPPGSQWARVVKVDKYGKKRSYLRKVSMPGQQPMQIQNMQNQMQMNMQPQQPMQMPNPLGVNYSSGRLNELSSTSHSISMDNLVSSVKNKAIRNSMEPGFNPDKYLK
jgi:hypothetical protein